MLKRYSRVLSCSLVKGVRGLRLDLWRRRILLGSSVWGREGFGCGGGVFCFWLMFVSMFFDVCWE